jgi:hypothetical protein
LLLPIGTDPGHGTGKGRTAVAPLNCVQKSRNADFSCYNVMPLLGSTLFATIIRPLKEKEGLLLLALVF